MCGQTCSLLLLLLLYSNIVASLNSPDSCLSHLISLLKDNKNCLYILESSDDPVVPSNTSCIVLTIFNFYMLQTSHKFDLVVTYFYSRPFLESLALFAVSSDCVLIVVHRTVHYTFEELFRMFWIQRMANVLLFTESLEVYTYYPISKNPSLVYLGFCSNIGSYSRESKLGIRPNNTLIVNTAINRPLSDFDKASRNQSLENEIVDVLHERLKFVKNISCLFCGLNEFSQTILPPYDIAIAGVALEMNPYVFYQPLYYAVQNELAIYIHFAEPMALWKNAYYIFDPATWSCIFAVIAGLAIVGYLAKIDKALTYVVSILLLNSCKTTSRLKLLFEAWDMSSLILTSVYSGLFVSFLCKSNLERQLSTLEEIIDAGYQYGATHTNLAVLDANVYGREVMCTIEGLECYRRLVEGNFGYVCSSHKMAYQMSQNETHRWYQMTPVSNPYLSFLTMKSSPYSNTIRYYLQLLAENGVIYKLDVFGKAPQKIDSSEFEIATLKNMSFIFIALFVGIIFATVAFVFELVWKHPLL